MFIAALGVNDHTAYDWIIDFSATQHMMFKWKWFTIYESILPRKVYMGNDTILESIDKESIKATMQVGGRMLSTTITQILHVPKMKNRLIFVSKFISEGFTVSLTRMVVRWTMPMKLLWQKHKGKRTSIFSMSMFERFSKWQPIIALWTTKAKYMASTQATKEAIWMKNSWRN
jgi:hypothetical protein